MFIAQRLKLKGIWGNKKPETATVENEKGDGDDESVSWVPALAVFDVMQARITADVLNNEGIPTRLRQEGANRAIPVNIGQLGLIEVMVPQPLLEKAEAIVDDLLEAEVDLDFEGESDGEELA